MINNKLVKKVTPRCILLSTFAISKRPSPSNAACHLLALKVLPDCGNKKQFIIRKTFYFQNKKVKNIEKMKP
jgi:hypothetical protein